MTGVSVTLLISTLCFCSLTVDSLSATEHNNQGPCFGFAVQRFFFKHISSGWHHILCSGLHHFCYCAAGAPTPKMASVFSMACGWRICPFKHNKFKQSLNKGCSVILYKKNQIGNLFLAAVRLAVKGMGYNGLLTAGSFCLSTRHMPADCTVCAKCHMTAPWQGHTPCEMRGKLYGHLLTTLTAGC